MLARLTATHQSNAFLNIHSHGETVTVDFHEDGIHGHCHSWTQRSGCGIMARCRPSAEHSPAIPAGLPLGFIGYSVVGNPSSSAYCTGTRCWFCIDCKTSRLLNTIRPTGNDDKAQQTVTTWLTLTLTTTLCASNTLRLSRNINNERYWNNYTSNTDHVMLAAFQLQWTDCMFASAVNFVEKSKVCLVPSWRCKINKPVRCL